MITHLQIGYLFGKANEKSVTVQNACSGFKKTGISPLNPHIFPKYLFEAAETTNIAQESNNCNI